MKIRPLIVIIGCLMAIAVLVSTVLVSYNRQRSQALKLLPQLAVAEQKYLRDRGAQGQSLLIPVTLRDLVKGEYISSNDAKAFDGMDVKFYPPVGNRNPQAIVVLLGMANGDHVGVFADGSIGNLNPGSFK